MFDNTESDVKKLTHCRTYHLHGCFPVLAQTPGELFDNFVVFHGADRRKVKSLSDSAAAEF